MVVAWDERMAAVNSFLAAAETLCRQVKLPMVTEIWEFLRRVACYAEPEFSPPGKLSLAGKGWVFPEFGRRRRNPVYLLALFRHEAAELGEEWGKVAAPWRAGTYLLPLHCIVLFPDDEVPLLDAGLVVIHESFHALEAWKRRESGGLLLRGEEGLQKALAEDCEIYLLQGTIWAALGGAVFQEILEDAVAYIQNCLRCEDKPAGSLFVGLDGYDSRLNAVLGATSSPKVRRRRKAQLDILANLEVVRRSAIADEEKVCRELLRAYYTYEGIPLFASEVFGLEKAE
jgi:hypothetical protein